MPSKKDYDAVFLKLRSLASLIESEAKGNDTFFEKIQNVLMGEMDSVSASKPLVRQKSPNFSVVSVLHENGEQHLLGRLELMTNEQLIRLAQADGIKRIKEARNIERSELIRIIVETANNRLKQGQSFTR